MKLEKLFCKNKSAQNFFKLLLQVFSSYYFSFLFDKVSKLLNDIIS